jgi:hypothetical protein
MNYVLETKRKLLLLLVVTAMNLVQAMESDRQGGQVRDTVRTHIKTRKQVKQPSFNNAVVTKAVSQSTGNNKKRKYEPSEQQTPASYFDQVLGDRNNSYDDDATFLKNRGWHVFTSSTRKAEQPDRNNNEITTVISNASYEPTNKRRIRPSKQQIPEPSFTQVVEKTTFFGNTPDDFAAFYNNIGMAPVTSNNSELKKAGFTYHSYNPTIKKRRKPIQHLPEYSSAQEIGEKRLWGTTLADFDAFYTKNKNEMTAVTSNDPESKETELPYRPPHDTIEKREKPGKAKIVADTFSMVVSDDLKDFYSKNEDNKWVTRANLKTFYNKNKKEL